MQSIDLLLAFIPLCLTRSLPADFVAWSHECRLFDPFTVNRQDLDASQLYSEFNPQLWLDTRQDIYLDKQHTHAYPRYVRRFFDIYFSSRTDRPNFSPFTFKSGRTLYELLRVINALERAGLNEDRYEALANQIIYDTSFESFRLWGPVDAMAWADVILEYFFRVVPNGTVPASSFEWIFRLKVQSAQEQEQRVPGCSSFLPQFLASNDGKIVLWRHMANDLLSCRLGMKYDMAKESYSEIDSNHPISVKATDLTIPDDIRLILSGHDELSFPCATDFYRFVKFVRQCQAAGVSNEGLRRPLSDYEPVDIRGLGSPVASLPSSSFLSMKLSVKPCTDLEWIFRMQCMQNPAIQAVLCATKNKYIVMIGSDYMGMQIEKGYGEIVLKGRNIAGKVWMKIRDSFMKPPAVNCESFAPIEVVKQPEPIQVNDELVASNATKNADTPDAIEPGVTDAQDTTVTISDENNINALNDEVLVPAGTAIPQTAAAQSADPSSIGTPEPCALTTAVANEDTAQALRARLAAIHEEAAHARRLYAEVRQRIEKLEHLRDAK